jgi:hypothetical protein
MKCFNAFFQETGASKLANAERGCLLDGPSLCHPTTQIFWLALPTVNSASAAGSQTQSRCQTWISMPGTVGVLTEYYMSGQFRKGNAAGESGEAAEAP